ncbi:TetR/AcrR family transcriptional regulator [Nocardia anaemiae]|uniref:TetR/AcrR family transcriptional regulator n=1 Tax=Nocardia anaemiae TaxID=263910 RepID=UPI0007A39CEE|nr:TetR/AcrR family transcriptional regulator [Nocardia anaemiae]
MAQSTTTAQDTDQRLAKGARSRASIARHAADVASIEGLTGLSIGRLATDLGISKSGIATLFGTKEALQVAAVKVAREAFVERVIAPSLTEPRGLSRLRAIMDRWFDHITEPTFPGGCFRVATIAEFDSKPGPVRDAIAEDHREWLDFLAKQIRHAQEAGDLTTRDADAMAFEFDAVISAANTARQMGDDRGVATARTIVNALLS